ncbi:Uncharacterised protein [Vibrio cholerae]|nr:Uncharacterised protein [Vibrio cholerae]
MNCCFISALTWPMATVRVMSVVPSRYWPPESTKYRLSIES